MIYLILAIIVLLLAWAISHWLSDTMKCPKCGNEITWNDMGYDKWNNCDNCGFNPNYPERTK